MNKCPFYGVQLAYKPGEKLFCPLCGARLVTIERNGRAWVSAHDPRIEIHTQSYRSVANR